MLAAGYKRCEVADKLGITAPAVTEKTDRVEREWDRFQGGQERAAGIPATLGRTITFRRFGFEAPALRAGEAATIGSLPCRTMQKGRGRALSVPERLRTHHGYPPRVPSW